MDRPTDLHSPYGRFEQTMSNPFSQIELERVCAFFIEEPRRMYMQVVGSSDPNSFGDPAGEPFYGVYGRYEHNGLAEHIFDQPELDIAQLLAQALANGLGVTLIDNTQKPR